MNYKIKYDSLRQEGLKPVFEALENSFDKLGIDFYLVGAIARDTWFVKNGIEPLGTKDIDFAIYIPSKEDYKNLIDHLVKNENYNTSTENEFVVFSPNGTQVDLLPFGEIEIEGKVMVDGVGLSKIAVNGFREVYKNGLEEIEFDNSQTFKVCSLPSIVILKLIAYDDRPEIRQKDIQDISLILNHYFDIETELIYEQHNDLFEDDRELSIIAARVIGRQIKTILNESKELENRIINILEAEVSDVKKSKIAEFMIQGTDKSIKDAINILNEMLKGLKE